MSDYVDAQMMQSLIREVLDSTLTTFDTGHPAIVKAARSGGWTFEVFEYESGETGIEAINHAVGQAVEFRIEVSEA